MPAFRESASRRFKFTRQKFTRQIHACRNLRVDSLLTHPSLASPPPWCCFLARRVILAMHQPPALPMPRMEVGDGELMRSKKGHMVHEFMNDPSSPEASDVRRTAASRAMLSVREKSSHQLSDCIAAPEGASLDVPRTNEEGRPTTRTAMLAMRKEQGIAHNAEVFQNMKSILPVGVQPGAPGKNPEMRKFNADDVHRNIGHPPK